MLNKLTSYISGSLDITLFHFFSFDHRLQDIFWARLHKTTSDAKLTVNTCALKRLPDPRTFDCVPEETHYANDKSQWPNRRFQVLKVRQRFLVFCRFFNSYVIFWFSDHDHYSRSAFPGKPKRWARSRRIVSTLNLSTLRNRTDRST